jgi:hypothetical protein
MVWPLKLENLNSINKYVLNKANAIKSLLYWDQISIYLLNSEYVQIKYMLKQKK